ncbi:uncharacterized protein LOC104888808 isoform X1 [Beta vulgaris subsp. vulgaris]|uniref:uncharacterized protein LOC104888808 isoform X1 n=2 Tax=Beta vulgaris subsp. vulgaris TaxID=3555 RepID=UPI002036D493|nr:uncharacterized protein LOC104888808 isoform X1 [Beta vulgaris subsp. vulgaris]
MATLPFRPPQFSDDVAWLPAWLQPNQSTASPQHLSNEEVFLPSLQNVDPFEGENRKESNILTSRESRFKICHLYLSGEESSPITLTPSCEKQVRHFDLRLSTGGTSSIVSNSLLDISQDDKLNSATALVGAREKIRCNTDHDSSKMNIVPSPSDEIYSGCFANRTPSRNDARHNTIEIFNSKCAECSDISDAVELSVAASEALSIHNIVQSELPSENLSTSAILKVALRVKQARLDVLKDSLCCFKDSGNSADTLSDLGDSDMEDAYKDVGLSVSNLGNIPLIDPSISRVKETPQSEFHGVDNEAQCEMQGDHEIYYDRGFATELQESNPGKNKSKDLVEIFDNEKLEKLCRNSSLDLIFENESRNRNLDDLQTVQEETNDKAYVDGFPHQLEVRDSPQSQHSRKERLHSISTIRHSHYVDMNEENNRSSCRFQSRWFGGWTGLEGDACNGSKSPRRKSIPKLLIGETSYLSESMDVIPDQNSVVHNHHLSSNAVESGKPFEDSCNTANKGALVSQEVAKDSTSFIDPLCSMVPCSISEEISDSFLPTNNNVDHQLIDAFRTLPTEITMGIAQINSGRNDEYLGRQKHNELVINDVGSFPLIRRQLTSLKNYSTGLPVNSSISPKRSFSLGENNARVLYGCINSLNDKDSTKQPLVISTSNCATAKSKQEDRPIKFIISSTTATNNEENHVANACGRLIQDHCEINAEKKVELHVHLDNIPTSPLVLCHKTRRFKAPKLHVGDISTANLLEDQAPSSNEIYHNIREIPQGPSSDLPKIDIPTRKRVHFSDADLKIQMPQGQLNKNLRRTPNNENWSSCRLRDRSKKCDKDQGTASQEVKERLTKCRIKGRKRTIFQGLDFLLTGFSKKKEKEIEGLLRKHGGMVLSDIPAPPPHSRRRRSLRLNAERLPVVLCTKKLQTTRFLYGCAVNAFLLKLGWAYDSISVGSVLPPDGYLILSNQTTSMLNQIGKSICQNDNDYIFAKVGVMLQGTHSFCSKLAKVIKHGQGHVYKSLQWLAQSSEKKKVDFGVIVTEDESRATRHLKKCASEQNIAVVPARWITNSLFEGKLLPVKENYQSSTQRTISVPEVSVLLECSQEI